MRRNRWPARGASRIVRLMHMLISLVLLLSSVDPHLWLEDLASSETRAWVREQDERTRAFTAGPLYDELRTRIEELSDFDGVSVPVEAGTRLFYTTTTGISGKAILHADDKTLLDTNTFDASTNLGAWWPSPDGKLVAYSNVPVGSRWGRVRILRADTGEHLPETLAGFNASTVTWLPDGRGFFYTRYDEPKAGAEMTAQLTHQRVAFHRPGTAQSEDEPIFSNDEEKTWNYAPAVTADGRYLVLHPRRGSATQNRVYVKDLRNNRWTKLVDDDDASYSFRGSRGSVLFFQTDDGAPRSRIVSIDVSNGAVREVLAERTEPLYTSALVRDTWIIVHGKDARSEVRMFDPRGRFVRDVKLPDFGTLWSGFVARPGSRYVYFNFGSLTLPASASVFRLDVTNGALQPFRRPKLPFDPSRFTTEQVFFTSKDGTRVPMFIACRKGLRPDGAAPAYLYGYGAFGWVANPWYQPHIIAWMERGGVYAMVNTRGGGEYGDEWRRAGVGRNRQNAIDDYIAAAEYLIAKRYTTREHLVANGGSASTPLAGAAVVQRPDLFGAALLDIPIFDLARFHLFTGGSRWIPDFGSPEDPQDRKALLAYSPYHNLRTGTCYPPMLVTAGEKDELAVPSHAYKFIARLQAAQGCANPALLQIAWGAGHSYGTNAKESAATLARQWAFVYRLFEPLTRPSATLSPQAGRGATTHRPSPL